MFADAIDQDGLSGTFNAVAPNPVTNAELMRELRHALHRPWSPPAPEFAVRIGSWLMKSDPSLALAGCRCAPKRFLEAGFKFQFPELQGALENLFS
jgi:NAD dependent epimerase/dehydratase family enzyme